jgi:hypothetical protein
VKAKFYRQFYFFCVYFFISLFAFLLRPKALGANNDQDDASKRVNTTQDSSNDTTSAPVKSLILYNLTEIFCNYSGYQEALIQTDLNLINSTINNNSTVPIDDRNEWTSFSECPLLDISTLENRVSCRKKREKCNCRANYRIKEEKNLIYLYHSFFLSFFNYLRLHLDKTYCRGTHDTWRPSLYSIGFTRSSFSWR